MEIRALLFAMTRSKAGPLLVAAQVALTLAVIVNVSHVMRERLADASRPTGLDLDHMFWVTTQPSSSGYNYAAATQADLAYLNALPGVVAATATFTLPQTFASFVMSVASSPEGARKPDGGVMTSIYMGTVRFPEAMGLKVIAGRSFDPGSERPPTQNISTALEGWAPEVLVTRALAERLFPGGNALGKTLYSGYTARPAVVVGIVELMRANPVPAQNDALATQILILPIVPPGPDGAYVIRTVPGRRDELMARIGRTFAVQQPGRFVSRMEAYDVTAARARRSYRATVLILGAVAVVVLLVTLVGIAGLAAFNVSMRIKQLGIRRALGARRFHIVRYFILESWITLTAGLALGCLLAVAASVQFSRVYQVPQLPLSYLAGGTLLLWTVGLAATLAPALRAASVPPAVATRTV
jgi:putative ABC transport system permease protein